MKPGKPEHHGKITGLLVCVYRSHQESCMKEASRSPANSHLGLGFYC
jgi:hypothetical protein